MKEILYDWGTFNTTLFTNLNDALNEVSIFSKIIPLITEFAHYKKMPIIIAMLFFVALFLIYRKKRFTNLHSDITEYTISWLSILTVLVISMGMQILLIPQIKGYFDYPRPLCLFGDTIHIIPELEIATREHMISHNCHGKSGSFPSGHSMLSMTLAAGLWPILTRRGRLFAGVYVITMGAARIAMGVHFPADIIGGYVIAFILTYSIRRIVSKIADYFIARSMI
jgi:membrane-associated phospholipid phosphatase